MRALYALLFVKERIAPMRSCHTLQLAGFVVRTRIPSTVFIAILFLVFVGYAPVALFGIDESLVGTQNSDGDTLRQISFLLCLGIMGTHVAYFRGARSLLSIPTALVVLLGWSWSSVIWAVAPDIAARRLVLTTAVILTVSYSVSCMSFDQVIRNLCGFMVFLLLADWIAVAMFTNAVHQSTEIESELVGNWRGLHIHKNEAGAFCAIASILFIHVSWRARSFFTGPLLIILSLSFLFFSQSKTAGGLVFVAMLIGSAAVVGYGNPAFRKFALAMAILLLSGTVALVPDSWSGLLDLFDDPDSFTGRTQIWPVMLAYSSDHLLLGSGYGSFWSIGDSSPVFDYGTGWIHKVFQAHEGYLDILAQIGAIGLAITIIGLVILPMKVLFTEPLAKDNSRWLIATVLLFGWLHNLLESSLFDRANVTWTIMIVMYCLLLKARSPISVNSSRVLLAQPFHPKEG